LSSAIVLAGISSPCPIFRPLTLLSSTSTMPDTTSNQAQRQTKGHAHAASAAQPAPRKVRFNVGKPYPLLASDAC
jgi:hypothetical protein